MKINFNRSTQGGETEINNGKKLCKNKYSSILCRSGARISSINKSNNKHGISHLNLDIKYEVNNI